MKEAFKSTKKAVVLYESNSPLGQFNSKKNKFGEEEAKGDHESEQSARSQLRVLKDIENKTIIRVLKRYVKSNFEKKGYLKDLDRNQKRSEFGKTVEEFAERLNLVGGSNSRARVELIAYMASPCLARKI